ncbi:unnamed protein product, partial [Meganyctiphanes norvegica]
MLVKVKPYKVPASNTIQIEPSENILIRVQRKFSRSIVRYLCPLLVLAPWMYISAYSTINTNQESIDVLKRSELDNDIYKSVIHNNEFLEKHRAKKEYSINKYIPNSYNVPTNNVPKTPTRENIFPKENKSKYFEKSFNERLVKDTGKKAKGSEKRKKPLFKNGVIDDAVHTTHSDELTVYLDGYGMTITLGDRKLYHRSNATTKRTHSGIHLLALHEETHKMLYSSVFKTGMPAAAAMLERALDAI